MSLPPELSAALVSELGAPILTAMPVGGGCIHRALRLDTSAGSFFCKFNQRDQAANFAAEAQGLALLATHANLRVPRVRARVGTGAHAALVMDWIDQATPAADFWERLGTGLAALHRCSAPAYGLDHDNFLGSLPQANGWEPDFHAFWASHRLQPLIARAHRQLSETDRRRAERLLNRLDTLLPPDPPALLHGDLWRGNVLGDETAAPVLIDPAVHYGHREAELAFSRLFGGFAPAFYASYDAAFPLPAGWRERVELFNLYPLLVHLVLFGASYLGQVQAILKRYGT